MPLYPYLCQNCRKVFQMRIAYEDYDSSKVVCPYCQSENVERRLGRVRFQQTGKIDLNSLEQNPGQIDDIESDPRKLADVLRQMGDEMGPDALGPEYKQVMDRLEAGDSPEDIERDLPGSAGSSGDGYGEVFG